MIIKLKTMKNLLAALIPLLICLAISEKGISKNGDTKKQQNIPVIDKTKHYPKKALDPEVELTYILLETNKDVLLAQDAHVYYVSDKRMLITNALHGDVFIFDMDGKALSHFNEKGRDGYFILDYALYDEPNKEVFILDKASDKIYVYTENGARKRILNMPKSTSIAEIYNFDANTLLAFHEHHYGPLIEKQPYMFISKKDGSIISHLNITTNKANPRELRRTNENGSITAHIIRSNYSGSCKFGQDFILANMSCDTIYLLKQDKTLIPLFVQSPTVFTEPPIITSVRMKTDDFITFSIYPYDLSNSAKKKGGSTKEIKDLMYEFKTGQFFELEKNKYTAEKVDVPANTSVELIPAWALKSWLEKGKLKGELKQIAQKVDISDNPVIEITKFK
jgi:hypothetical protein